MEITKEFKSKVMEALLGDRERFEGTDSQFVKRWGIPQSVFSRLKSGETEHLLKDAQWLNMGRELNVTLNERQWKPARTDVFCQIEEEILFCKENSKAMIFVDSCEIGKTFAARYLSRSLRNCFYLDASQCKTKIQFIRGLARVLGIDVNGRVADVKEMVKYYIRTISKPLIIVDEAGDLEYAAMLELKELWNATENACGWYMIGADGLRSKIEKGIRNRKVGYRELFSRFSNNFSSIVPLDRNDRVTFYRKLITDVLSVNLTNEDAIPQIVKRCLRTDESGNIGGLRRAESLIILTGCHA